ncbi:sodium-dependent dicarboxylate transporter 2/3/5 [Tamaricihabitans halophyticus]|uniref:Sodium-dependent dicarboxylate transporter SdcS n=1 Tax=Tamaricihabitans halophyticus TaxID=1262583 RepID=A0A4R2PXT5_9PSEU|nr:DASS family sodium-coupled anion symporter [Tamaricihabitans halophyticus]TCP39055.1 sodium-dependent dicarboxylate transporter 2/3/5 [Tamaricihabitans halophyticus]
MSEPADSATPGGSQGKAGLEQFRAYRGIDELSMTEGEARFERRRQTTGLVLGPVAGLLLLLLPLGLPWNQQALAAVFVFTVVFWLTEAIPIPATALLSVALMVALGVGPADEVLSSFGSTIVLLYLGAFFLSQALLKHGLAERAAYAVLASRWVGNSVTRVIIAIGVVTCVFSAFVSNTVTVAMLLPTVLGIVVAISRQIGKSDPTRLRVATCMLLMLAFSASIGGALTPVGAPHQLIGRDLIEDAAETQISFFDWTAIAVSFAIPLFAALLVLLVKLNKPEASTIDGLAETMLANRRSRGRLSRGEWNTLIVFALVVIGWLLPGIAALVFGAESAVYGALADNLDEGVVAILGACLLFLLPTNSRTRTFTIGWQDAVKTDWGTLLFIICGAALGDQLTETGLAERVGGALGSAVGDTSVIPLTFVAAALAILISEIGSNLAAVGIVVPIIIPVAIAAGVDPLLPGLAATFGSSFGFMMPISTPQNALVYATGAVPITKMVRSGVVFDLLSAVFVTAGVLVMGSVLGLT